jgi:hypothetical protein
MFFTTHEYLRVLALILLVGLLWGSKPGIQGLVFNETGHNAGVITPC